MEKRKFRIGELAKRLDVERFVIRFWEKEFEISTTRSNGKQRFYDEDDYRKFGRIKELLYKEGFTIAGAKKQLAYEITTSSTRIVASQKTTMEDTTALQEEVNALNSQIKVLKTQLVKLRELL
jgi:DNA-binding transcriptional MerR regulator